LLLAHEARIQANLQHVNLTSHSGSISSGMMSDSSSTQALAMQHNNRGNAYQGQSSGNYYRKNNFRGRGRGRHSNFSKEQVQCQICYKWGHTALKCYHRFDVSYIGTPSSAQSTSPHALLVEPSASAVPTSTWFLDSGASTHVTPDINNLSSSQPYLGVDKVHMGNGSGLSISHTGTTSIPHSSGTLHLGNVLCVPHLTKNLLSIAQLLKDNSVSVVFTSNSCFVKDLTTQRVLLHGSLCNGLYALDIPSSPHVQVHHITHSSHSSSDTWHTRLAHCSPHLLKLLHRNNKITLSSSSIFSCTDCIRAKSHKLPFSNSSTVTEHPLHVVHTDVWGPSPVLSTLDNRYYVLFTDQFSRFSWVYFCSAKSDIP
jgi:GAG-pre-integrase domain